MSRVGALLLGVLAGLAVGRGKPKAAGAGETRPVPELSSLGAPAPADDPDGAAEPGGASAPVRRAATWRWLAAAGPLVLFVALALVAWVLRPIDAPRASTADPGSVSLLVRNPVVGGATIETTTSLRAMASLGDDHTPAERPDECRGSGAVADARPLLMQLGAEVRVPLTGLPAGAYHLYLEVAVVLAGNARLRDPEAAAESMEQQLNLDLPPGTHVEVSVRRKILALDNRRQPVQVLTGLMPVYVPPDPAVRAYGNGGYLTLGGQVCGSVVRQAHYWTVGQLPRLEDQLVTFTPAEDILSPADVSSRWQTSDFDKWNKTPQSLSTSFDPEPVDYDVRVARPVPDQDPDELFGVTWSDRAAARGPSFRLVDLDAEASSVGSVFWAGIAAGLAGSVLIALLQDGAQTWRRRAAPDEADAQ